MADQDIGCTKGVTNNSFFETRLTLKTYIIKLQLLGIIRLVRKQNLLKT